MAEFTLLLGAGLIAYIAYRTYTIYKINKEN